MSQARRPTNDALGALASLCRLGRSLGIHVVGATQRPDAGVLPGQIKANIPATVAFKVREALNSRISPGRGERRRGHAAATSGARDLAVADADAISGALVGEGGR